MRYLLLIYSNPSHYETLSEQDMGQLMAAYGKFSADHAPKTQGAERLQPVQTATTVRLSRFGIILFHSIEKSLRVVFRLSRVRSLRSGS